MVKKYKQDNGLSVLLEPVDGVVSVSVGLWIKTGSRDESKNQYGYAHFVEHMLFKGTENYSAKEIAKMIDRVGGQHNAATNREYTCYYINVVSDYLDLAIKILSDMFYNSAFNESELNKEKKVIIEEIRMYEDAPDEYVHDVFVEKMFKGHPLSHSILGTIDEMESSTRKGLYDFYEDNYKNDNAVLVITGKFDNQKTEDSIAKYFNKETAVSSVKEIASNIVSNDLFNKHISRDLEQVHFCMGADGITRDSDDRWPLYILSTILGGSMSSRLFQNIREKEGISYSIYSFHSSYIDNGIFGIYSATIPENFNRSVELIIKECKDLLKNGITGEELEDTKTFMIGNVALSMESIEVRMGQLAKNELTFERSFTFKEIVSQINSITLDDFNRISEKLFRDKEFSMVSIGRLDKSAIKKVNLKI